MMAFETFPLNGDTFLQNEFVKLKKKYSPSLLVETGTYKGLSTIWFANHFDSVWTMEVNETYYRDAMKNISTSGHKNISAHHGDSRTVFPRILGNVPTDRPVIFFLDAHWYENPVLEELRLIAEMVHRQKVTVIVVIHDMKNPDDPTMAFDKYPEQGIEYCFEWVKPSLMQVYDTPHMNGFNYYFPAQAAGARAGTLICVPRLFGSSPHPYLTGDERFEPMKMPALNHIDMRG